MLEQMQREMVALRNKVDGNGTSNAPQGQNTGSSSPAIQYGALSVVPNIAATTGAPPTTSVGMSSSYITEERLHELLKSEAKRANKMVTAVHFQPPYPSHVTSKPYLKDYVKLKFRLFDGKKCSGRKYVISFIDDLGIYADDLDLRLREFNKSLIGKAYSWFVNLPSNSIKTWKELVVAFCPKFFIAEHKLSITDLADEPQKKSEPLAEYVTRFKERALDCKEIVPEASLINICV